MLTNRDIEMFKFINRYGKTYEIVLSKTFFTNKSTTAKRLKKLEDLGLISYWNTSLSSPRRAIILTQETREFLENEHGIKPKFSKLATTTIHHNIIEQLADFWLQKIGQVERTTAYEHSKKLHQIPDFIFTSKQGKRFNVEVERTKKTLARYKEILINTTKDGVDGVLYILMKQEDISRFMNFMPRDNRLLFIDIESMISNIKNDGKINPVKYSLLAN